MSSSLKWFLPGAIQGTKSSGPKGPLPGIPTVLREAGSYPCSSLCGLRLFNFFLWAGQKPTLVSGLEDTDREEGGGEQLVSRVTIYIFHQRASPEKLEGHGGRRSTAKQFSESPKQALMAGRGLSCYKVPQTYPIQYRSGQSLHMPLKLLLFLLLHQPPGLSEKAGQHPRPPPSRSPSVQSVTELWPSPTSLFLKCLFCIYFA